MALINKLKAIADAVRAKTGKTDKMTLDQMATEIMAISGGGGCSYIHCCSYKRSSSTWTYSAYVIIGNDSEELLTDSDVLNFLIQNGCDTPSKEYKNVLSKPDSTVNIVGAYYDSGSIRFRQKTGHNLTYLAILSLILFSRFKGILREK